MPGTISGRQIWSLASIGATTMVAAAAAPYAVVGVVGAMGFEASGIAAGSMAAGMMSAEAIAGGGTVAAGGTVATLQSIGAAGLGVLGTTSAVCGGVTLGAATSVGVVQSMHGLDASSSEVEADLGLVDQGLPLCSWRQW